MLKFFAEKMWVAFAMQKLLTFFQQKISEYCILNPLKQLTKWPLTSSLSKRRFEQLGPGWSRPQTLIDKHQPSVAQSDAHPSGDQEEGGVFPQRNYFMGIVHEKFSMAFFSADSRKTVVSFWWNSVDWVVKLQKTKITIWNRLRSEPSFSLKTDIPSYD